jgi:hypothetical protein
VHKAMACVNKLVDQEEDEWKQQAGARKSQGRDRERGERGGAFQGGSEVVNPIMSAPMQLASVPRHPHENSTLGGPGRRADLTNPPLDDEKRTIEHIASQLEASRQWKATSSSSQQSLNGSYIFQRLREIQEQFQRKMTKLRAKQGRNREFVLRAEAQRRYQTSPGASNCAHYQYGDSGGSSLPPPPSARSDGLNYVDPLPQHEGPYEGSYDQGFEKGYVQNPADSSGLKPLRSTPYDSYPEAPYSPGAASYNNKQGTYEKPGMMVVMLTMQNLRCVILNPTRVEPLPSTLLMGEDLQRSSNELPQKSDEDRGILTT